MKDWEIFYVVEAEKKTMENKIIYIYTINITTTSSSSSSCSMTVYSSNTSLILTDLLTSGQNYSFAVAVTDSTGQHGPWSDQLMVTYHGRYMHNYNSVL